MKTLMVVLAVALLLGTSAIAGPVYYSANLLGSSESPPVVSPATGFAEVAIDAAANTLTVDVTFTGLIGTTTASHIHCCTAAPFTGNAGVATTTPYFAGFPLGVTSGSYFHVLDLTSSSSYNPSFVTAEGGIAGAEAALIAGIESGHSYLNIHSTFAPGGEIRGYLALEAPEPSTFLLAGAVLAGFLIRRRR